MVAIRTFDPHPLPGTGEQLRRPGHIGLRASIGVETAVLTFRTKQYSTSYSSYICYDKQFCNDFF